MKRMNKVLSIIMLLAMAIIMQGSNYMARKQVCRTIRVCPVCVTVVGVECPCYKVKVCFGK